MRRKRFFALIAESKKGFPHSFNTLTVISVKSTGKKIKIDLHENNWSSSSNLKLIDFGLLEIAGKMTSPRSISVNMDLLQYGNTSYFGNGFAIATVLAMAALLKKNECVLPW